MHKSKFLGGVWVHPTHGLIYAQVIAYAITEAGFWVGSVPFALGAAYVATGEIPDWRAAASLASPRLAVHL